MRLRRVDAVASQAENHFGFSGWVPQPAPTQPADSSPERSYIHPMAFEMRRGDRPDHTTHPQEHFRTPTKAPTPERANFSKPTVPSNSKKRSGTPASSISTSRSRRSTLPPGAQDQPTLTQIDFVTPVSQSLQSDDELDYIPTKPPHKTPAAKETIEIEDKSDNDADYQPPSHLKPKRSRGVQLEEGTRDHGPEKRPVAKRAQRKSHNGPKTSRKDTAKKEKERHKTLTQMDYVRRYLKIEPDDEVKLEYTYITPKKNEERKIKNESETALGATLASTTQTQPRSSERKRRKLDRESATQETTEKADDSNNHVETKLTQGPVTPQKSRRTEIPSSQSPESPGFAFISSSQFRNATRSPLKRLAFTNTGPQIKEEPSAIDETKAQVQCIKDEPSCGGSRDQPSVQGSTSPHKDSMFLKPVVNAPATQYDLEGDEVRYKAETRHDSEASAAPPTSTSRTVIYETDAESDYSDYQDDVPSPPGPIEDRGLDDGNAMWDDDNAANEDSLDLPPVTQSGRDTASGHESTIPPSETNLPSDASIYYHRYHPATQFPMEPLPDLNTQKLAELFPDSNDHTASNSQHLLQPPPTQNRAVPEQTQTQTQSQSQTQSQKMDQATADIVPESSPIIRNENDIHSPPAKGHGPSAPEAVVQVESSQPVDRLYRQSSMGQSSRTKGILTGSDFLTSSVMESVPQPAFWLGSQDSVGEPYGPSDT